MSKHKRQLKPLGKFFAEADDYVLAGRFYTSMELRAIIARHGDRFKDIQVVLLDFVPPEEAKCGF